MKALFVDWCPKDALDGMMQLDPWEELAYRRIIDLIYVSGNKLLDDDKKMGWMTKTGRRWPEIRRVLIENEKIQIVGGFIRNKKCDDILDRVSKKIKAKSDAGRASAEQRKSQENNKTDATAVDELLRQKFNETATDIPTNVQPIQGPKDPSSTAAATGADPACEFIRLFDDVRAEVFGENLRRLWPNGTDISSARLWLEAGGTAEIIRPMLFARMSGLHRKGLSPPETLSYFDKPVANAIAASKRTLPEGNPNDDPLHIPDQFRRKKPDPFAAVVAAGRSLMD